MFNKVSAPVCPLCKDAEELDYDKIRGVIDCDPHLNMEQVAEEAEVELAVVQRMVKEGMVTAVSLEDTKGIECGQCGAPAISVTKRLCKVCLDKMNAAVARAQSSIKLEGKKDVQIGEYSNVRTIFDEKRKR
jgi:hypothetical protein